MWLRNWRRFGAGLALFATLVLAVSQVLDAPLGVMDCCDDDAPTVIAAQISPTPDTGHDHRLPYKHSGMPGGAVCCSGGACSLISPMTAPALAEHPFVPLAITWHEARAAAADRLGVPPPLPPPRMSI